MSAPQYSITGSSPRITLPVSPRFGMQKAIKDTVISSQTIGGVKHVRGLFNRRRWTMDFRFEEPNLAAFRAMHDAVDGEANPFFFYHGSDHLYGRKEAGFAPVMLDTPADPPLYDYRLIITGVSSAGVAILDYEEYENPADVNPVRSWIDNGVNAADDDDDTYASLWFHSSSSLTPNYANLLIDGFQNPTGPYANAVIYAIAEWLPHGAVTTPFFTADIFNQRNKQLIPSGNNVGLIHNIHNGGGSSFPVAKQEYTVSFTQAQFETAFPGGAADIWLRFGQYHSLNFTCVNDVEYRVYRVGVRYT